MASMTPEERERFMERMRARGFVPAPPDRSAAVPGRGATTFDALFGPLTPTESFGQVWLHKDGKVQRIRLRLGITDGQQSELIEALDGPVEAGLELVTSITLGSVRQSVTPAGGSAFPGLGGGRQGFGGFPGGGGGRGGRGQ
jgi:hypothetical protein